MANFEALPTPVLHTVTAADGWLLRVWDFAPSPLGGPTQGVVVLGHAMMVDSRTLCRPDRPTLASVLVAAGFRVLCPDLRGHGESGPLASGGGDWDLDALISDVPHYVALARSLEPRMPIALAGHSLFGQVALAWLGQQRESEVVAVAALACEVWNKRFEPRRVLWWLKRLLVWPAVIACELLGYLPVRRLGVGTNDEARGYWRQFHAGIRKNRWSSVDGRVDYWKNLAAIAAPVLHMLSEGDLLYGRPVSAARWSAPLPERELVVLGRDDAPGHLATLRPSHMGMLTEVDSKLAWHWLAGWLSRAMSPELDGAER